MGSVVSEKLSEIFERFAREEFHDSSPLYAHLSKAIAKDAELLSLPSLGRKGERMPNLLFAAVHYSVIAGRPRSLDQVGCRLRSEAGCHDDHGSCPWR